MISCMRSLPFETVVEAPGLGVVVEVPDALQVFTQRRKARSSGHDVTWGDARLYDREAGAGGGAAHLDLNGLDTHVQAGDQHAKLKHAVPVGVGLGSRGNVDSANLDAADGDRVTEALAAHANRGAGAAAGLGQGHYAFGDHVLLNVGNPAFVPLQVEGYLYLVGGRYGGVGRDAQLDLKVAAGVGHYRNPGLGALGNLVGNVNGEAGALVVLAGVTPAANDREGANTT